ncbi:MAG: hypothetical protein A2201_08195 [Alicyclobacillus sp. RIFOXYA1_FULL_53_8]|nr:MAG: hypothetical protein A2201_08195 [Alicyclobacillus sp. RIFOXYA1_FULL_53_8]
MSPGLPDWMFAAFSIGGWELFDWIARRWHIASIRWVGGAIVAVSVAVLLVRYTSRIIYRMRHKEEIDPNEWKSY